MNHRMGGQGRIASRDPDAHLTHGAASVRVRATRNKGGFMQTYVIIRRNGWKTGADLEEAAGRSSQVGDEEMSEDIRWIRSYVLQETDGSVGTVCIYQASSPEAIQEHAQRADLPVDEIIPIADTVIVREDPAPATA